MPLVACPSCSCHAEASAAACPHCGAALAGSGRSVPSRAALALGLVLGVGALQGCPRVEPPYGLPSLDSTKTDTGTETGDTGAEETTE